MLDDAAVLDPQDVEDRRAHSLPGRRVAHERAVVRAAPRHAEPDEVTIDDEVLDLEMEVRERAAERCDHGLDALGAGCVVRAEVLMLHDVGRGEPVGDAEVAVVEALLDQAAGDGLGVGCGHVPPFGYSITVLYTVVP